MARITIKRDGLTLVGEREEPFGEVYNMAILMHGFTANKNTPLLRKIADDLRDENVRLITKLPMEKQSLIMFALILMSVIFT